MGIILEEALDEYLNEPRDDHRWLKQLSRADVDELIASLRPRPKIHKGLSWLHQRVAFYLGVAYPQFSFWIDMGGGKTLLMLELFRYWRMCGVVKRMLVFVKSDKAFLTWEDQIRDFELNADFVTLEGSTADKFDMLETIKEGIVLVTYPGAVSMCSDTVKGKRGKNKWRLQKPLVERLAAGVGMVVMDESTVLGNHQSLSHQLCDRIANKAEARYALAGRPFGRDPTLLWAQQDIIDGGDSFGTLGMFRTALFQKEKNQFSRSKWAFEYKFQKSKTKYLNRRMEHRSITYEEHEFSDVPKVTPIRLRVPFGEDMRDHYLELAKRLVAARGNSKEIKNTFIRMRQVTSGFIGFKDDETGEKAQIAFAKNPKLETLFDKLEEIPYGRKATVFYEFTWSAMQIAAEMKRRRMQHIWLWSGTKNSRAELQRFFTDEYCYIALIQNKVGAYSLDGLQKVSNLQFIYESPVSVIDREQMERRIKRQGQKRRVYRYDLVVPDSVDERILDFHKDGRDLMAAVRKDPKVLL